MPEEPLVSIVVPAYNNADYIARTMESILAQDYPRLEVIVADHASTDDTRAIVEGFADDPRVTLIDTEAGGGAERNWNRVSAAATGEYLKLVCGDDLIEPGLVSAEVAALRAAPGAVLAACSRDIIDAGERVVVRNRGLGKLRGRVDGRRAIRESVVAGTNLFGEPACVLMRRSALEAGGGWDPRFPYLIDQATYARVLLQGDFVAVRASLARFRLSVTQWSVRLADDQASQAAGFHAWLHAEHPDVVSERDRRRGDAAARRTAFLRRMTYLVLQRRMRAGG